MPRAGLTPDAVADAAEAVADAEGLDAVTIARVAQALGVRPPSLYNHVEGRDALLRALALRGLAGLGAALREAAVGRAGADAIAALATAYRAYAREHPGLYAATVRAPDPADAELARAAADPTGVVFAVLEARGLRGDDAVHAARALRSALHGFTAIEAGGGFGLAVDTDRSFAWMVRALAAALAPGR